jgi:peptidoglycan/LPS O-acetylase OafA/YrhL
MTHKIELQTINSEINNEIVIESSKIQSFVSNFSLIKINNYLKYNIFNFDFILALRGIACLCVVFLHAYWDIFFHPFEYITKNSIITLLGWPFLLDGHRAVQVFFVLSGYLMYKVFDLNKYTFSVKGLKKFYTSRFRRIYPLYFFVLFSVTILHDISFIGPDSIIQFIKTALFNQYTLEKADFIFIKHKWFSTSWSLVVEAQYYMIAPIIAFILTKFKNIFLSLFIILFVMVFYIFNLNQFLSSLYINQIFTRNVIPYIPEFILGAVIVNILKNEWLKSCLNKLFFILPLLLVNIFILPVLTQLFPIFFSYISAYVQIIILISTALSISIFESENYYQLPNKSSYQNNSFDYRTILEKLGQYSYGIYLWHLVIVMNFMHLINIDNFTRYHIPKILIMWVEMSIVLIIIIIFAKFTYENVELKYLKKYKSKPN